MNVVGPLSLPSLTFFSSQRNLTLAGDAWATPHVPVVYTWALTAEISNKLFHPCSFDRRIEFFMGRIVAKFVNSAN
jgi:hypothetical protein